MDIKELNNNDKPRERILKNGPRALSDTELLAIIIGSGTKENDVFAIAITILKKYKLYELKDITYEKLSRIKGIKQAKATKLLACFELARRCSMKNDEKISLITPKNIYEFIYPEIYLESNEIIISILVDCKLKPIKKIIERRGYSHQVDVPLRKIILDALDSNAYGLILVHNHPSGDVIPSNADITATINIKNLLSSLDILFLDHLVVSKDNFYSMNEYGILDDELEYSIIGDGNEKIHF